MYGWKRLLALLAVLAMTVGLVAACGQSPPGDLTSRADQIQKELNETKDVLQQERSAFDAEFGKPVYQFMAGYSDGDKHVTKFGDAQAKLDEANKVFNEQVKSALDDYNDGKRDGAVKAMDNVQSLNQQARDLASEPLRWIKQVVVTKNDPAAAVQRAEGAQGAVVSAHQALTATANGSKQAWPNQVKAIDGKVADVAKSLKSATVALDGLHEEAAKPKPNYAVMTDLLNQVLTSQQSHTQGDKTLRGQLAGLPVSETHTLLDIRVDGEIEVARTTWNDYYDAPTEHDYEYPPVKTSDAELLAHFGQFGPGTVLASDGAYGDFGTASGVDRGQWDKLGIDTQKDWPGGDNAGEYYMGELDLTYCHKLFVLKNGKPDSSGRPAAKDNACDTYNNAKDLAAGIYWEEADDPHLTDIGMDIYSKAAGDFADQATEAASPPGIVYVGNPQYGEWKRDSNGNEFWQFFATYLIFSNLMGGPSPFYSHHEYDTWNRDYRYKNTPYYSTVGTNTPRFGANAPMAASRFPNSQYSKSKLSSPSVRSAGPMTRGGGPGGGGK